MKIYSSGANLPTPKNYSRKKTICSCECTLTIELFGEVTTLNREKTSIKYEVEPTQVSYHMEPKLKQNQWASYIQSLLILK